MSKTKALRELKRERRLDVLAYVAAITPDDVRLSAKMRRALKRRKLAAAEPKRP